MILDKPTGITSNSALQKIKYLYQAQKAGHTGSLDPLATGVLPICLGEATKVSHFLLDADKTYRAKCILGSVTTTGDSDGDIIATKNVPKIDKQQLTSLLNTFIGTQQQTPPMYSALKYNGRPLYEYARKGIEIERKSRQITIFDIKLIDFNINQNDQESNKEYFIEIEVYCSKGTYIRSLCEDIGQAIGCGAHISELRRTQSGPFTLSQSITIDSLNNQFGFDTKLNEEKKENLDQLLLATDSAIEMFPPVTLNTAQYELISHGHMINYPMENTHNSQSDFYRLYYDGILIALATLTEESKLKPKRLLFL